MRVILPMVQIMSLVLIILEIIWLYIQMSYVREIMLLQLLMRLIVF